MLLLAAASLAICTAYVEAAQALAEGGATEAMQIQAAVLAEACADGLGRQFGGVQQYHGCLSLPGGVTDCRWRFSRRKLPLEPLPRRPFEPLVPRE